MCPFSLSTAMPSGSRHLLTITLRSEPSGFSEITRFSLASRTNKRPSAAWALDSLFDLADCNSGILFLLSSWIAPQAQKWSYTQKGTVDLQGRPLEFRFQPVSRQVRDGDHHEAVRFAKPDQVRHAGHGPVVVDNLADHARGVQTREA